jgi:biopolymer transport protein ExbB/TolQ
MGPGVLLYWLVFAVVVAGSTGWLLRRVGTRWSNVGVAVKAIGAVATISGTLAILGTLRGLVDALRAMHGNDVDPSQKARMLAEGISTTMNSIAIGAGAWLPSVIVLFILVRKRETPAP